MSWAKNNKDIYIYNKPIKIYNKKISLFNYPKFITYIQENGFILYKISISHPSLTGGEGVSYMA
jgi:hypothetical protein